MTANGRERVVEVLNDVLTAELTAINQYFLHGELCAHWGFTKLGSIVKGHSIDEMKHAHVLIERVLFLDGLPNVQRLGKVNVGESVAEQFKLDTALEQEAIERLNSAIALCHEVGDHGTRGLLEEILKSEEEHLDWIDGQSSALEKVGEANYLATLVQP